MSRLVALWNALRRPPPAAPAPVELVAIPVYVVLEHGRPVAEYRYRPHAEAHAQRHAGDSWFGARVVVAERLVPIEHAREEFRAAQQAAMEERRAAHAGEVAS